ncbi:MAG TPA: Amuc_1100 family pilus-like protein [Verrucomicrobiae bacterium]|nr:Amuc_1100 family pilus-like protein [Verrucomicrobiae bacterium]
MAFIKKHLVLLIAAVVSLGVLAYAVIFVQQKKEADAAVSASVDEAAEQFRQLLQRKVHPGNEKVNNIEIAKQEVVKMRSFMDEMRDYLKGPQIATNLNNQMFRAKLDTTVAELRRQAEEAGVTLPNTNFWFTYGQYKTTVDFKNDAVGLAAELEDIRAMMRVVYDARVHALVGLKRVPVGESDNFGTFDYIPNRYPKTNDWAVTTSYEMTFQGFSSELARVMEGLANAKQCFVVKSVGVAQAPEERKPGPPPAMMNPMPMYNDPYARYRMPQQQFRPPPPAAGARPQPTGLKTVLDENKLRFTLLVDSVRLKGK